jgi:hypothetical protein
VIDVVYEMDRDLSKSYFQAQQQAPKAMQASSLVRCVANSDCVSDQEIGNVSRTRRASVRTCANLILLIGLAAPFAAVTGGLPFSTARAYSRTVAFFPAIACLTRQRAATLVLAKKRRVPRPICVAFADQRS